MATLGEKIRQRRIELGLTQSELGNLLGYKSRSSINKIELSRSIPLNKLERMAKALETTPSYLMGWKEPLTAYDEIINFFDQLDETGKQDLLKYAKYLASNEESRKEE